MMLHLCIQASSVVKEPWAERWPSPKGSGMIMAHYGPDIWFRYKSKDWAMVSRSHMKRGLINRAYPSVWSDWS